VIGYKFKIGETINFTSPFHGRFSASGTYLIVDHRPPQDGEPSYLIKSELEEHQRIARESELHHGPDQSDQ
jgi:hypothetical protein